MFVKLVALKTATGADTGSKNSGVSYLSVHVNVLTVQKPLRFWSTGEVEDYGAVQLVGIGAGNEAHLADQYAFLSTELDTRILTQAD